MSREPHQDQKIEGSSIESSQVQLGQAEGDLTQFQGSNNWALKFVINLFGNQQSSPRQEYRNRQALIDKVRRSWIEGVLERSLFDRVQIELGLERCFDALALDYETPEQLRQPLPKGIKVSERFFQQLGVGRTLLILGASGAGKTTILLELARDLLVQADCDVNLPIPVVFNLSSWINPKQSIADWLVQELNTKYQVSKALGRNWIKEQQLFLLLDGLDEVRVERQEDCVKAINHFAQSYGQTEIVVCSRIADYEAISQRFRFQAAIFVQPLSDEQVKDYLNQAGEKLIGIKTALQTDVVLQELTHNPLMLSVMTLAYEGFSVEELPKISLEERRKHLFDKYIERMFQRRRIIQYYSKEKIVHWLTWLAQRMIQESQTVFLIEDLQPTWLQPKVRRRFYRLSSATASCLIIGGSVGILFWLTISRGELTSVPILFLVIGLPIGLISALIVGLGNADIEPVETLGWSWERARRGFRSGFRHTSRIVLIINLIIFVCGIFIRIVLGLHGGFVDLFQRLLAALLLIPISSLNGGIFGGLINGLASGLRGSPIQKKSQPNQSIFKSVKNAVIVGFIGILFCVVIGGVIGVLARQITSGLGVGLTFGVWFLGPIISLSNGGKASIKYFALRLILYQQGCIPWNYPKVLDYAADRLFLQKVGGGYVFVHRLLMEHFAQMGQDSQNS